MTRRTAGGRWRFDSTNMTTVTFSIYISGPDYLLTSAFNVAELAKTVEWSISKLGMSTCQRTSLSDGAYIQAKATKDGLERFLVEWARSGGLTIRNLNMIVGCVAKLRNEREMTSRIPLRDWLSLHSSIPSTIISLLEATIWVGTSLEMFDKESINLGLDIFEDSGIDWK